MRKYLLVALGLAALAAATTAVPAFTATPGDSGTVHVSITAQAPAAPCLTVTPGSVDFGTLPFTAGSGAGPSQGTSDITVNFCGTATGQNLLGSTTPATGPSGTWFPLMYQQQPISNPCPTLNSFFLQLFAVSGSGSEALMGMTEGPRPVTQSSISGTAAVFPAGDKTFRLIFTMPCQGSSGAGETKTLTATFTAVVP